MKRPEEISSSAEKIIKTNESEANVSRRARVLGGSAIEVSNTAASQSRSRRRVREAIDKGIPVSIPGHPEIEAYKLPGNPIPDDTVDMLIELHHRLARERASETPNS